MKVLVACEFSAVVRDAFRVYKKPEEVLQSKWMMPPRADRAKERSRFFPGIAQAMAEQWGKL